MSRTKLVGLLAVTLIMLAGGAILVDGPGYTDADYYFAIGEQISQRQGFQQPFIWNYLAEPNGLPQPAHLYWMPLTSLLASLPLLLMGAGYRSSQLVFLLLAALLPGLTVYISRRLGGSERQQTLSWLLSIFPAFYLPFFLTTDAFVLFALLAVSSLLLMERLADGGRALISLATGFFIGLSHLTRADGLLLFIPAVWAVWSAGRRRFSLAIWLVFGYLIVMGPWMGRMLHVSGAILSPGASKALWLHNYDELFSYPADFLSPSYLAAAGWGKVVLDRLRSLGSNLVSLVVVNHLIFLLPLTVLAGWDLRRRRLLRMSLLYLGSLLLLMSFVFPFPGSRGGFFHSSTAIMPIVWALAPIGLDRFVTIAGSKRGWDLTQAKAVFSVGVVVIAAALTIFLAIQRLAPVVDGSAWGINFRSYRLVGERIGNLADQQGRVAVNNPPSYWNATGQAAVVIPNGDEDALLRVVRDFEVDWVVLEANHPAGLADLYENPKSTSGLEYIESIDPPSDAVIHLFQVKAAFE